jgi:hypothetical protein
VMADLFAELCYAGRRVHIYLSRARM